MKVIAIDPGKTTGVILHAEDGLLSRGFTKGYAIINLHALWHLLEDQRPSVVVYEEFALRQGSAMKLVGDKFLTCEVIGVIKLWCQLNNIMPIVLQPATKEYCGFSSNPKDPEYEKISWACKKCEHVRDAYRLLRYAQLFKGVH